MKIMTLSAQTRVTSGSKSRMPQRGPRCLPVLGVTQTRGSAHGWPGRVTHINVSRQMPGRKAQAVFQSPFFGTVTVCDLLQ